MLGGKHRITYDMEKDMLWRWDQVLKTHPNGMRFSVFDENGDLLATNEYFRYALKQRRVLIAHIAHYSVGGGFVVNEKTKGEVSHSVLYLPESERHQVDENLFYKGVDKSIVHGARLHQSHSLMEPPTERHDPDNIGDPCSPPYPFAVSNLAL